MKKFVSIIAVILAVLTVLASCTDKNNTDTTTLAQTEAPVSEPSSTEASTDAAPATEPATEEPTTEAPTTEAPTTAAPTTQAPTTAAPTTKAPTTKAPTTKAPATKAPTTKAPAPKTPSTKAEIVALYNAATERAASAKPGYSKSVNTALSNLQMGALAKLGVVRDAVGDFLGEGQSSSKVSKGKFDGKSLKKSTLTANDVTSATCKLSSDGKYYDVTITVKNETNPLKKSSALGKFTADYKDIAEIKDGLAEAGAGLGSITVNTTSVVIKAKIAVANKNFVSLSQSIKMHAVLTDVKYSVAKVKQATTDLSTAVDYSSFVY